MEAERGEEAAEEKSEISRGWFMMFEDRSHMCDIKVQSEGANSLLIEFAPIKYAGVAELANVPDLGSGVFDVGVQVPSLAPEKKTDFILKSVFF